MASKVTLQVHHVRFFEYQPLPINCIAHDSSSQRVAVSRSDGSVQIFTSVDNWAREQSFPGSANSSLEALVWSQNRLFAAGLGGNVVELDLDTLSVKNSVSSNAGPVWCLTSNQEGNQLAAGTEDGCLVLYNIEDELQLSRAFGKQEGRILSVAWYSRDQENIIITGGANNIRQWSVNSGQPISRMTLGHTNNKDTIVWCLMVTRDFTIISGDSRGVVTFWNGQSSTQLKNFHCHKADVLCLSLSQDEMTVYSGGVDAAVYKFTRYSPDSSSDRLRWLHQLVHAYHSHDVRALAAIDGGVISGGVDCILQVAKLDKKRVNGISPFPADMLVCVDKINNLILLRYRDHLELWQLGTADVPEKSAQSGILPLTRHQVKLIQLEARKGQEIACSALSSHGLIAFSDLQRVRIYHFEREETDTSDPQVRLERVKHSFSLPARLMTFSESGDYLMAVLVGSGLEIMNIQSGIVQHKFKTDSSIHLLKSSPDNQHVAYATVNHKVYISNFTTGQIVCQCPVLSSQVTAINFSPHNHCLFIAYNNQKVYEVDITKKEYSSWCRKNSQDFQKTWIQSTKTIKQIIFHPNNPDQMFLYTDSCLVMLDRSLSDSDRRSGNASDKRVRKCFKYQYLLHADFVQDGSLVVVERPPSMLEALLPPSLKQKKFGLA